MADDEAQNEEQQTEQTESTEESTAESFSPDNLAPEAQKWVQEQIRRGVQSESDRKAKAVERKIRQEMVDNQRQAASEQENKTLAQLAEKGDFEALGSFVAQKLTQDSQRTNIVTETSQAIEQDLINQFSETLGEDTVARIQEEVVQKGGAHGAFGRALAEELAKKTRAELIEEEVKAKLIEAGVLKRSEEAPSPETVEGSPGPAPTTFEEIEAAYGRGEVSIGVYEKALKERGK